MRVSRQTLRHSIATVVTAWLLGSLPICVLAARPSTNPSRVKKPATDRSTGAPRVDAGADWGAAGNDADRPDWRDAGVAQVQLSRGTPLTFAPTTRPVAVAGDELWDLAAGRPVTKLRGIQYDDRSMRALSGDGTVFALVLPIDASGPERKPPEIAIWSTTTGEPLTRVRSTANTGRIDLLSVTPRVLLACPWHEAGTLIETWDVKTGKPLRRFKTPARISHDNAAASPDARFVAVQNSNAIIVLDINAGRQVAQLKQPQAIRDLGTDLLIGGDPAEAAGLKAEARSAVFWSAEGLAFSPDGKELAGLFSKAGDDRLVIWDVKGNVVQEAWVPGRRFSIGGPAVEWVPDRSGVLVSGRYLFSRKAGRVVWAFSPPDSSGHRFHFLDRNWLLVADDVYSDCTLAGLRVPWDRIDKSIEAMSSPETAAHVRPGAAVALKLEVGQVRSTQKDLMTDWFGRVLTTRLTRSGLRVDAASRCVLRVVYDEIPDGQQFKGRATFQFVVPNQAQPAWQATRELPFSGPDDLEKGAIHPVPISLVERENQVLIPYFLPAHPNLSPLPLLDADQVAE